MLFQLNIPVLGSASFLPKPPSPRLPWASFPSSILYSIPHIRGWYSPERNKTEHNSREKEGGGEQPCIKLFFKWWWGACRREEGQISVQGPREAGFMALLTTSFSFLIGQGAPLASLKTWVTLLACSFWSCHDKCHRYVCQHLPCWFLPDNLQKCDCGEIMSMLMVRDRQFYKFQILVQKTQFLLQEKISVQ